MNSKSYLSIKTTACRRFATGMLVSFAIFLSACGSAVKPAAEAEEEALSRTEFTDKIENFFEHDPLKTGKPSQFLIHLTDLSDGTPVEKADVTLLIRKDNSPVGETKARVGKVTGIYVADVTIASPGEYDIEFRVQNSKLSERMPLKDFKVE